MTAVGRLLRTLRSASALTVGEVSARSGISPARLRRLERGAETIAFLEGRRLAKALDVCQPCLLRLAEAADERDQQAADEEARPDQSPRPRPQVVAAPESSEDAHAAAQ